MGAFRSLVHSETLGETCEKAYELIQLLRLGKLNKGQYHQQLDSSHLMLDGLALQEPRRRLKKVMEMNKFTSNETVLLR